MATHETGQAVAVRQETSVALGGGVSPTGIAGAMQSLASDGFEDLEQDFYSFPTVVLDKGMYVMGGTNQLGTSFSATLGGSRGKWIFKNVTANENGKPVKKDDEDFVYSYGAPKDPSDPAGLRRLDIPVGEWLATNGKKLKETFEVWKAKGWDYEDKKYLDVSAEINECSLYPAAAGQLVVLSIPKTSTGRFTGHVSSMKALGYNPKFVPTVFTVGEEITKGVPQSFNPWKFDFRKSV